MKLVLVIFYFLYLTYLVHSQNSLDYYLDNDFACIYNNMYNAYLNNGLRTKLNGTTKYTLFAICDVPSGQPPIVFNTSNLNYHLVTGTFEKAALPTDGTLPTQNGDSIRVNKYGNTYFFNGVVRFGEGLNEYFNASQTTNGAFYTIKQLLPAPTNLTKNSILSAINRPFIPPATYSIMRSVIQLATTFTPPTPYWTLFLQHDNSFATEPLYRREQIYSQAKATSVLSTLVFSGTQLVYPLSLGIPAFNRTITSVAPNAQKFLLTWLNTGGEGSYSINNTDIVVATRDAFRSDGVIQLLAPATTPFYPPGWTWDLPTISQFVSQWVNFSLSLKAEFIPANELTWRPDKFIQSLVDKQVTIPPDCTIFMIYNSRYTTTLEKTDLNYYIVPGQKKLSDFSYFTSYTTQSGAADTLLFTPYGGSIFVNGIAKVVKSDIQVKDAYIHIIDEPITKPANASDTDPYKYRATTVLSDVQARFPKWASLWTASSLPKTNVTVFPTWDNFYNFDISGTYLYNYLSNNATARDEYLSKFIVKGIYYPKAAQFIPSLTALDGTVINIYAFDDVRIDVESDVKVTVSGATRSDGVDYGVGDDQFIFFPIPAPPEPEPEPEIPPPPDPIFPPAPSSAGFLTFNLVFLLLSYLFVIIC